MPGTAASHMIFFIVSVVIASSLVGVLYARTHEISTGIEEKANSFALELRTDIEIINDPENVKWYDDPMGGFLEFYVKNTGTTTINNETIVVIYDGNASAPSPDKIRYIDSTKNAWVPGSTIAIKISTEKPKEGGHRVKVIVDNNADDTMEFVYYGE